MAAGDLTVFDEAKKNIGNNNFDLSGTTDFSCMLITTIPTASDGTPDSSDYTEVSGGTEYTAGGVALSTTWNEAAGTVTFDSSVNPSWTQDASGPANIRAALIYSETATEDALCFIDMTSDGSTAISLVDGDITITFDAAGLFTLA